MEEINQLFEAFKIKWPWLSNALLVLGALKFALTWFNQRLQKWMTARIADSVEDVEMALKWHSILSSSWYGWIAFVVNFLSVRLPTHSDFHKLLQEKHLELPLTEN